MFAIRNEPKAKDKLSEVPRLQLYGTAKGVGSTFELSHDSAGVRKGNQPAFYPRNPDGGPLLYPQALRDDSKCNTFFSTLQIRNG